MRPQNGCRYIQDVATRRWSLHRFDFTVFQLERWQIDLTLFYRKQSLKNLNRFQSLDSLMLWGVKFINHHFSCQLYLKARQFKKSKLRTLQLQNGLVFLNCCHNLWWTLPQEAATPLDGGRVPAVRNGLRYYLATPRRICQIRRLFQLSSFEKVESWSRSY